VCAYALHRAPPSDGSASLQPGAASCCIGNLDLVLIQTTYLWPIRKSSWTRELPTYLPASTGPAGPELPTYLPPCPRGDGVQTTYQLPRSVMHPQPPHAAACGGERATPPGCCTRPASCCHTPSGHGRVARLPRWRAPPCTPCRLLLARETPAPAGRSRGTERHWCASHAPTCLPQLPTYRSYLPTAERFAACGRENYLPT